MQELRCRSGEEGKDMNGSMEERGPKDPSRSWERLCRGRLRHSTERSSRGAAAAGKGASLLGAKDATRGSKGVKVVGRQDGRHWALQRAK